MKLLLVLLLFVSHIYAQQPVTVKCSPGCGMCRKPDSGTTGKCVSCIESFLIENECHEEIDTTLSNCLLFVDQGKCAMCKPGYALNFDDNLCFPINDPKAVTAYSYKHVWQSGEFYVSICEGGYPTTDGRDCVSFPQTMDMLTQVPTVKCLWADKADSCLRCDQNKVSVTYDQGETYNCSTEIMEGCLVKSDPDGNCLLCDFWNGYYSNTPGTCAKRV